MFGLFLLLLLLLVAKKKKKVLFFYFYDDSILARAFFWLIFIHFYFQCVAPWAERGRWRRTAFFFNPFLRLLCAVCLCVCVLSFVSCSCCCCCCYFCALSFQMHFTHLLNLVRLSSSSFVSRFVFYFLRAGMPHGPNSLLLSSIWIKCAERWTWTKRHQRASREEEKKTEHGQTRAYEGLERSSCRYRYHCRLAPRQSLSLFSSRIRIKRWEVQEAVAVVLHTSLEHVHLLSSPLLVALFLGIKKKKRLKEWWWWLW